MLLVSVIIYEGNVSAAMGATYDRDAPERYLSLLQRILPQQCCIPT